ncbi:DUF3531 family protein [Gloeobacter violaceus]|uniref:Glr1395 protein n=1 Tax=Gloeobacter violaceus (strain ATCC 29082 / PCC 7421) TaxID=251221 RepID=Q7NKT2_GLOVI|nr:DUF3531 family protein [Gloeobacter violaceus]BAC89336.1 glr1395 [Gloeobacter violaceus PCC 7421]
MQVILREINWTDLWLWLLFEEAPAERQRLYLEQVLDAWYSLGLLGGFNASRLPLHEAAEDLSLSYATYDLGAEDVMPALMHNMGDIEYDGRTAKCWFDLGTADSLSLDVLINAVQTLNQEYLPVERLVIGGSGDAPPWGNLDE